MAFYCTNELGEYMKEKGKHVLSVEVASSDRSDFEVTELYLRLVKDDFAEYLKEKKRYRARPLFLEEAAAPGEYAPTDAPGSDADRFSGPKTPLEPVGEVLLPPYRLEIGETVTFGLKKVWLFRKLTMEGIRL